MSSATLSIRSLPTRYEPLTNVFGQKAKATFIESASDIEFAKRLISSAESAQQGKIAFISAASGSGKSTFVHGLEIFLADKVDHVERIPEQHELPVEQIPGYIAKIPRKGKITILNFDGRESPYFDQAQYQTFLGSLNGVLRQRPDLVILWPVTDPEFAERLIGILKKVGGNSAFGISPIHALKGPDKGQFSAVLEKILQVANWRLDDAAISTTEVEALIAKNDSIGAFLDALQSLITERFDVGSFGITFPMLVITISSGAPNIREVCRSLRRADSYYIEASRLLMYTRRSNVSEWWQNRSTHLKSALPHVIALFNAQLASISASCLVHAIAQHGKKDLKDLTSGVRADKGNAKRVMASSELYKFLRNEPLDNREYGSSVSPETYQSFDKIQAVSESRHRSINQAVMSLALDAGAEVPQLDYEKTLVKGLQTDVTYTSDRGLIALEFHHKATSESNQNKIAIYVLEKLKEYAINYGLADR
ncbi:hypothetical protein Alvin_1615 [Allochromatium vinosum DSM 180]|uniref:Uncharacterized protein n=1 Tax=Allochromatium vinosum (strain ATCC 17899 / DSM 180 / NBRC 103801 / NCIMB 10441 / D) TaxID=572477 RepID=D3RTN8_ALLVD|nr:hypothetical protein Alvin_1615 [Allochromatium vinosum DSM 180]